MAQRPIDSERPLSQTIREAEYPASNEPFTLPKYVPWQTNAETGLPNTDVWGQSPYAGSGTPSALQQQQTIMQMLMQVFGLGGGR